MKTLLTVALTSQILPGLPEFGAKPWKKLRDLVRTSDESVDWLRSAETLDSDVESAAKERIGRLAEFEQRLLELDQAGVGVISEFDEAYPQRWIERLGERTAPVLFFVGEPSILNRESFGIVGSRDVDDAGQAFTAGAAAGAAERGLALVSGGARGVDSISMRAAYEEGGSVFGILSDSLLKSSRDGGVREMLESGRACLCTPYSPEAPFSVGNAMGRNKLIYAHANATLVVSSDLESGGTWSGAIEAMRLELLPIFVRDGDAVPPGNRALIAKGGVAIESPHEIWDVDFELSAPQGALF